MEITLNLVFDHNVQAVQQVDGFGQGEPGLVERVFGGVDLIVGSPDEVRFGQVAVAESGHLQLRFREVRPGQISAFKIEVPGHAADEIYLFEIQSHEDGMVQQAVEKVERFDLQQAVLGPVGETPVDPQQP